MNDLLKKYGLKVLPYLLALSAAGGFLSYYNHAQREIGARNVLLAQSREAVKDDVALHHQLDDTARQLRTAYKAESTSHAQSLADLGRSLTRAKLAARTAQDQLAALIANPQTVHDTVIVNALASLDSLISSTETDTASAGGQIRACQDLLLNCEARANNFRAQRDQYLSQLKKIEASIPTQPEVWAGRLGWAGAVAGLTLLIARFIHP